MITIDSLVLGIYLIGFIGIALGFFTGDSKPINIWEALAIISVAFVWPIYLFTKLAHILEDI